MTYSEFIQATIDSNSYNHLNSNDMQFAFITWTNFDITVNKAVELALEFKDVNYVSEEQKKEFLNIIY